MRVRRLIMLLLSLMPGCASPGDREHAAEARGYERGYAQAVRDQYAIIQNQQRRRPAPESIKP
jgi:hypothetical protein